MILALKRSIGNKVDKKADEIMDRIKNKVELNLS